MKSLLYEVAGNKFLNQLFIKVGFISKKYFLFSEFITTFLNLSSITSYKKIWLNKIS